MGKISELKKRIRQARDLEPADLVIKNARFLNVVTGELVQSDIAVSEQYIVGTYETYRGKAEIDGTGLICVPGFIDSHVHVESTLLTPYEFERCVMPKGTTTAVCDPHEIANVLGLEGIRYFLEATQDLTMDLRVQLSSCVPATHLETSGASLTAQDLLLFKNHPKTLGLAEMMNFPGLLKGEEEVLEKIVAFSDRHIDGHAPLVRGYDLNAYCSCRIRNCHESTTLEEAEEKLKKGMQIFLREGTVAKDIKALSPLLTLFNSPFVSLCTDDRNPLDIQEEGHLDFLIRHMILQGAPIPAVYRAASWSAAQHFGLTDRGLIAPGFRADFVLLSSLETCRVEKVICGGKLVSEETFSRPQTQKAPGRQSVKRLPVTSQDFQIAAETDPFPVIGLRPGSLLTDALEISLPSLDGFLQADPRQDVQKVCVLHRHGKNKNIGRGFVRGFGLKGPAALASTVAHDSHNLMVVGSCDRSMAVAVNHLLEIQGGFVIVSEGSVLASLPLPVAGLMSDRPFEEVEENLLALRKEVQAIGCPLPEPFLQMAFLALPVIPHLKITDCGLIETNSFRILKN